MSTGDELDEREARVRELLAEVRGATKDLQQAIRHAKEVQTSLLDQQIRERVTEQMKYHLEALNLAMQQLMEDSTRKINGKANGILLELQRMHEETQQAQGMMTSTIFHRGK